MASWTSRQTVARRSTSGVAGITVNPRTRGQAQRTVCNTAGSQITSWNGLCEGLGQHGRSGDRGPGPVRSWCYAVAKGVGWLQTGVLACCEDLCSSSQHRRGKTAKGHSAHGLWRNGDRCRHRVVTHVILDLSCSVLRIKDAISLSMIYSCTT